jgi:hypothetical protein
MNGGRRRFPYGAPGAALMLCAVTVGLFVWFAIAQRHSMAVGDYWVFITQRGMDGHFDKLFSKNELHLMALPRLVFALDELISASGFYLTFLVALACLAALAVVAAATVRNDPALAQGTRLPLACLAVALVFSAGHLEVMTEPAKLWIPASVALSAGAIYLAAASCDSARPWRPALGAALLIVAATLSGLVGLLAIPVTLALALRPSSGRAGRLPRLAILAVGGLTAAILYFSVVGLPPQRSGMADLVAMAGPILTSWAAFLGAPLERILQGLSIPAAAETGAIAVGFGGLFLTGLFWLGFLRRGSCDRRSGLWLGLAAFGVIWGFSVAMRDLPGGAQPLSRYDLPVSLFWAAIAVLIAQTGAARRRSRAFSAILMVCLVLFPAVQAGFGIRAGERQALTTALRIAIAVGVRDPALNRRYAYYSVLDRIAPTLRARGLAPFDAAPVFALGDRDRRVPETPCRADSIALVPLASGGARLHGRGGAAPGRYGLRVIDAGRRLVGLGEKWSDGDWIYGVSGGKSDWLAYVAPGAVPPLTVYAAVAATPCILGEITLSETPRQGLFPHTARNEKGPHDATGPNAGASRYLPSELSAYPGQLSGKK